MDIGTQSAEHIVNVGSASNLYSLYSTAATLIGRDARKVKLGLAFLQSGSCKAKDCAKAADQLGVIRDELAKHTPTDAVWDVDHPNVAAPWQGNLAPSVTNCADLYTTSEGELMLPQLTELLRYAADNNEDVVVLG